MKVLLGSVFVLALIVAYYVHSVYSKIPLSRELIARAVPFSRSGENTEPALLVLGDSTAVGVGAARPEDTVAALVAQHIDAGSVENYARSGATIADLSGQAAQAKRTEYDVILIEIGGNDIIRFHDVHKAETEFSELLVHLPKADAIIVHSAANVGGATLFPWFIRPFHTALNMHYHEMFTRVCAAHTAVYVNLYVEPKDDLISQKPDIYLAKDGLHPSSAGYALWFEKIRKSL